MVLLVSKYIPLRTFTNLPSSFSAGKVLPFTLTTPDNETLGSWLVLANDIYEEYVSNNGIPEGPVPQSVFDAALL